MRFIAIALLALLVCTTVMAQSPTPPVDGDNTWVANGGPQEYWGSFGSSMWGGFAGAHNYNNVLTATAVVNNFAYDRVENGNINFTIGDPRFPVTGKYDGHMTVNTACIWSIVCSGSSVGVPGYFDGPGDATMPATWALKVGGAAVTLTPISEGLQAYLPATDAAYEIFLTATPGGGLQAPGTYVLDPEVSIRPQG